MMHWQDPSLASQLVVLESQIFKLVESPELFGNETWAKGGSLPSHQIRLD